MNKYKNERKNKRRKVKDIYDQTVKNSLKKKNRMLYPINEIFLKIFRENKRLPENNSRIIQKSLYKDQMDAKILHRKKKIGD